ncbi:MAG TPA: hypothetical protein PK071_01425 [Atopobiaceae bacterium]|nr:hypothetical protein [Atopobiaceae bacterium]
MGAVSLPEPIEAYALSFRQELSHFHVILLASPFSVGSAHIAAIDFEATPAAWRALKLGDGLVFRFLLVVTSARPARRRKGKMAMFPDIQQDVKNIHFIYINMHYKNL